MGICAGTSISWGLRNLHTLIRGKTKQKPKKTLWLTPIWLTPARQIGERTKGRKAERKEERNPRAIIIYSHIMAAVKASTCINVFMRRRTSTHTHTLSLSKRFAWARSKGKRAERQRHEAGREGKMRGKTITIHNSVGCRSASGTRLASDVRLSCAALLLMSLLPCPGLVVVAGA